MVSSCLRFKDDKTGSSYSLHNLEMRSSLNMPRYYFRCQWPEKKTLSISRCSNVLESFHEGFLNHNFIADLHNCFWTSSLGDYGSNTYWPNGLHRKWRVPLIKGKKGLTQELYSNFGEPHLKKKKDNVHSWHYRACTKHSLNVSGRQENEGSQLINCSRRLGRVGNFGLAFIL